MKITVVILTKNEAENIKECINSVKFADEIILIDDNSSDKTINIAKKLGAKVYTRGLNGDFSGQRNFGLKKTKNEWVFFLDADERASKGLATEISKLKNGKDGYYITRRDFLWEKELTHGESGDIKLLRLAKKNSGKWMRKVHEIWNISGKTGELKNTIKHFPHPTTREFIAQINRYSSLHSEANIQEGKGSSIFKIIFWPKLKFVKNYVFRLGFLDGTPGFVAAMIMSFNSFLSWSRIWLKQGQN